MLKSLENASTPLDFKTLMVVTWNARQHMTCSQLVKNQLSQDLTCLAQEWTHQIRDQKKVCAFMT